MAPLILARRTEYAERMVTWRLVHGVRWHLEFMGAELNSWHESGNEYRITWTHGGQTHSMDVARSGFVESAGVCLEGTDRRHNLSSIVAVMQEHARLGRTY